MRLRKFAVGTAVIMALACPFKRLVYAQPPDGGPTMVEKQLKKWKNLEEVRKALEEGTLKVKDIRELLDFLHSDEGRKILRDIKELKTTLEMVEAKMKIASGELRVQFGVLRNFLDDRRKDLIRGAKVTKTVEPGRSELGERTRPPKMEFARPVAVEVEGITAYRPSTLKTVMPGETDAQKLGLQSFMEAAAITEANNQIRQTGQSIGITGEVAKKATEYLKKMNFDEVPEVKKEVNEALARGDLEGAINASMKHKGVRAAFLEQLEKAVILGGKVAYMFKANIVFEFQFQPEKLNLIRQGFAEEGWNATASMLIDAAYRLLNLGAVQFKQGVAEEIDMKGHVATLFVGTRITLWDGANRAAEFEVETEALRVTHIPDLEEETSVTWLSNLSASMLWEVGQGWSLGARGLILNPMWFQDEETEGRTGFVVRWRLPKAVTDFEGGVSFTPTIPGAAYQPYLQIGGEVDPWFWLGLTGNIVISVATESREIGTAVQAGVRFSPGGRGKADIGFQYQEGFDPLGEHFPRVFNVTLTLGEGLLR